MIVVSKALNIKHPSPCTVNSRLKTLRSKAGLETKILQAICLRVRLQNTGLKFRIKMQKKMKLLYLYTNTYRSCSATLELNYLFE